MKATKPKHLFISYAQADADDVVSFVSMLQEELTGQGAEVDIWMDRESLRPGEQWQQSITTAVADSVGMLVFVSPESMRSNWVRRELQDAVADKNRLVVPVILHRVADLPRELTERQWLDISTADRNSIAIHQAVSRLAADIAELLLRSPERPPLDPIDAKRFAAFAAEDARAATGQSAHAAEAPAPDSVFVVHGHDEEALREVCNELVNFGVRAVVLSQLEGSAQSLLQKFFSTSKEARFAIVLLTSDDFGASRVQYEAEGVADRALQFRARQNVILKLGFFYGYLGWEKVFVLLKKSVKVFPNFERPSDLDGAIFDPIDESGKWKISLAQKLRLAGFRLSTTM